MSKVWYCVNCGYEVGSRAKCHVCKEKLRLSELPKLAEGAEDDEVGYRLGDWEDRTRGRLIESLNDAGVLHRFEDDELVVAADDEATVDDLLAMAVEVPDDAARPATVGGGLSGAGLSGAGPSGAGPSGAGLSGAGLSGAGPALEDGEAGPLADSHTLLIGGDPVGERSPAGQPADGGAEDSDRDHLEAQVRLLRSAAGRLHVDPTDMAADAELAEASAAVFATDDMDTQADTWAAVGRTTRRLLGALAAEEALDDEIRRQAGILAALLDEIAEVTGQALAGANEAAPRVTAAGETVYELPAWLPEQRAELTMLLRSGGIRSTWDGEDLVVPADREADVEVLFDQVHGLESGEEQDDEQYRAIEELFNATSRLVGDPDDPSRAAEYLRTVGAVEGSVPLGFDGIKWTAIRKRGRILADSIEHKANPEVIESEATSLRELLRALV